jgi:hypothetical protein
MRIVSISAAALVFLAAIAAGQDSTRQAAKEQTLSGWHGFQALHFDLGGASVPGDGRTMTLAVVRVSAAFTPLPDWSLSWSDQEGFGRTSSYTVPGSGGFHPSLSQSVQGLSLQRRWKNTRGLHPVAGASVGLITNSFDYSLYFGSDSEDRQDEKHSNSYLSVEAGVESNVAHWFRISVSAGYRMASNYTWSTGSMRNSGATITSLFEFGKF